MQMVKLDGMILLDTTKVLMLVMQIGELKMVILSNYQPDTTESLPAQANTINNMRITAKRILGPGIPILYKSRSLLMGQRK